MKTETQNKIDFYVELYDRIQERAGSDDVTVVIFQEMIKDMRMKYIAKVNDNGLATDRQKECLKNMGKEFPESITRKEASDMIQKGISKE